MLTRLVLFIGCGVLSGWTAAQSLPIIPKPLRESRTDAGEMVITPKTLLISAGSPGNPGPQVKAFNDMLEREAGFRLKVINRPLLSGSTKGAIVFEWHDLADWGFYGLKVRPDRVLVHTNMDESAFHATQTLRQIITSVKKGREVRMTSCDIYDKSEFKWRGMHLDVSRHFFKTSFVKEYIDWISEHKMNKFHWHLVDDGGWRMESKRYPLLTQVGAWRAGDGKGWNQSTLRFPGQQAGEPLYGGFYSQAEIKQVLAYAKERFVDVVPEIEMPGHCLPVLAAYPELGCRLDRRPVNNVLCPANPKAMEYAKSILDETMELFPSQFIHIGADEVDRSNWKQCPDCQALMKKEGLADDAELQSWFVRQMDAHIRSKGRRMIGWDEILDGGLAETATVMSWRGSEGGIEAAKQGKDAIMSPNSHCYFDYTYENISTQHAYTFKPIADSLKGEQRTKILGGQANVWTEWIETEDRVEFMIYPRIAAIAESVWLPSEKKNWNDFRTRLLPYMKRLDKRGINYCPPAPGFTDRAVIFQGRTIISVPVEKNSPWTLRYTTDGSVPTLKSPIYTKPFSVDKAMQIKFAYVNSKNVAGTISTISTGLRPSRNAQFVADRGLRLSMFEGKWSTVPDFSKLTAVKSVFTDQLTTDLRPRDEFYALQFAGWIRIDVSGEYTFELGSDDGSWLKIAGAKVVDQDGLHGYTVKTGKVMLEKGIYPIEVGYFEADGADRLTVRWQGPGSTMKSIAGHHLGVISD